MKNLKKVLALVLAFACAFTMFAGAAFTDQADFAIKADVVDTLVQLGVIEGYKDGSFNPDGTVTRAEMAKMIYVVRTGRSDASAYNNDKTSFTDITTHWARGYIKYCQSMGIIAGKSATRFAPDETVTTQEAAKMLLVTLGYNAERVGLVGSGWGQRTNALADENGLLEDVNNGSTAPLPRQYAAQLIYNAIDTPTVVWRDDAYTSVDVLGDDNATIGEKFMDLVKDKARVGDHDNILTEVSKEDGRDTYTIRVDGVTYTRVKADYSDLMGQDVVVMYKKGDSSKVFGVYAAEDSTVLATGIVGDMESVSDAKKVKLAGTEYKLDAARNATGIYNFNADTNIVNTTPVTVDTYTTTKLASLADGVAATTVKLIDNDGNGKADRIVAVPRTVHEVTYVGSSNFSLQGKGTVKFDDCESVYSDIAKDDYAIYTDGDYTASGDHIVVKASVVSEEVKGTKENSGAKPYQVRVNNEWKYLVSSIAQNLESGTSYDLVVVDGVVFNADEVEANSRDILAIVDVDVNLNTSYTGAASSQDAKVVFMDGSKADIEIEKLKNDGTTGDPADVASGNKLAASDIGKLYSYTKKSNDKYELKLLSNNNKAGYKTISDVSAVTAGNKIAGKVVADDAVVFVIYGGKNDLKVINGKTVNDWSSTYTYGTSAMVATKESNGIDYVKVAAIVAPAKYTGAGSDYQYGYLTAKPYTSSNNPDGSTDKCTAFEIWNGTENVTVYTDGTVNTSLGTGDVLVYTVNGQYIEVENNASDITMTKAAVYGFDYKAEGHVSYKDAGSVTREYKLHEDCVFLAVNDDKNNGVGNDMNQLIMAQPGETNPSLYIANAVVVTDSDNKVVAIVFDVDSNKWHTNTPGEI